MTARHSFKTEFFFTVNIISVVFNVFRKRDTLWRPSLSRSGTTTRFFRCGEHRSSDLTGTREKGGRKSEKRPEKVEKLKKLMSSSFGLPFFLRNLLKVLGIG
jgi:hypothetical protein